MTTPREQAQRRVSLGALVCLGTALALGAAPGCSGADPMPEPTPVVLSTEAPVQRLTNSEYIAAVEALFAPLDLQLTLAALPPAVDVDGFDNHLDLSAPYPSVVESYRLVALDVAIKVTRDLETVSGCVANDRGCIGSWLRKLGDQIAWRTDAGQIVGDAYEQWADSQGVEQATRLAIQLLLLSPDFGYAPRTGNRDDRADVEMTWLTGRPLAKRLALLLWNAPPDAELLAAADAGVLDDVDGVRAQATRLLADPRARAGVRHFYEQLLEWGRVAEATLDPDAYLVKSPHVANDDIEERTEEFTGEYLRFRLQPAMRAESELFVEHQIFDGGGSLRALLTGTQSFGTWDLGALVYGVEVDQTQPPVRILPGPIAELSYPMFPMAHDASKRRGLLTFAAFLHGHSGPIQPSPVRRGAFVMERLLCTPPEARPPGVPPIREARAGDPITNRDRFADHTAVPACQTCHEAMDSIGFTFEHYDSMGAWRDFDADQPVDASGALFGTDQDGPVAGAVDLAEALADSRTVHDCHVRQWFRYSFGRTETPADGSLLKRLGEAFWVSDGDIQGLILELVSTDEFRSWRPAP